MEFRDDSDGEAESESELAPCPYCDGKDCKHEVLWHSRCNCDWIGLLADETKSLEPKLEAAIFASLKSDPEAWLTGYPSMALMELMESAVECFDGTPKSLAGLSAFRTYWLALADDDSDATVIRVDWDGGGPGMSDSFFHVFFENPDKELKHLLSAANDDLAYLKSLVAPAASKKPGKPRKKLAKKATKKPVARRKARR